MEITSLYEILLAWYGPPGWWPLLNPEGSGIIYHPSVSSREKDVSEKLEIAIGAILTQNTSWNNVVTSLLELKKRDLFDPERLKALPVGELASMIRSAGYYNQKALKIQAYLDSGFPTDRGDLLEVWGIGEETADSILLYAYNKPWFVVDAYTRRIFLRLNFELIHLKTYLQWQCFLANHLPADFLLLNQFHALLVNLAKDFCRKNPTRCDQCPLRLTCRSSHVFLE